MLEMSRKNMFRWCKKALKYGVLLYICYWFFDFCVRREEAAEARARYHKRQGECSAKLAGMEQVPILGGGYLDRTKIPGFFFGSDLRSDGSCIADILEGAFWWTGTEIRTALEQEGKEPPASWEYFKLSVRLYNRTGITEPHTTGYRHTDWPDELIVKLKNYPGLELWLNAPPPDAKNESYIKNFVMSDWRRHDGTPRLIECEGLASSDVLDSDFGVPALLKLNMEQLENLDFGDFRVYCMVDLDSFDFAGGDGRLYISSQSLKSAPEALKTVSDHLSSAMVAGK